MVAKKVVAEMGLLRQQDFAGVHVRQEVGKVATVHQGDWPRLIDVDQNDLGSGLRPDQVASREDLDTPPNPDGG